MTVVLLAPATLVSSLAALGSPTPSSSSSSSSSYSSASAAVLGLVLPAMLPLLTLALAPCEQVRPTRGGDCFLLPLL